MTSCWRVVVAVGDWAEKHRVCVCVQTSVRTAQGKCSGSRGRKTFGALLEAPLSKIPNLQLLI